MVQNLKTTILGDWAVKLSDVAQMPCVGSHFLIGFIIS